MTNQINFDDFSRRLFDLLEAHFGTDLELVFHDLTSEYSHTISDIRNGHVTGRKIGGTGDQRGLMVLKGMLADGDAYNEILYTEDGKTLKCSTMFIYDDNHKAVGSICVNQDITKTVEFEHYLRQINCTDHHQGDLFIRDVNTLLDKLITEAQLEIGKHPSLMTKEDKIDFIRYLDTHGAFLISKSGPKICKTLNISRYSLYKYLDIARGVDGADKGTEAPGSDKED